MIESIYIIDIGSGVPLFSLDLIEIKTGKCVDKEMFSGFLKVLDDFSQETRNEEINEIYLASSRFVYEKTQIAERKLLLISIDDQKDKSDKVRMTLKSISNNFEQGYKTEIGQFQGNIDIFKSFETNLREIITKEHGTFKEKMELKHKHKEHPIKSLMSKISKKSFIEFEKKKLGYIMKISDKPKELLGKIKNKIDFWKKDEKMEENCND